MFYPCQVLWRHHILFSSHAGILKKKQLSPIVERNGLSRIHNELCGNVPGTASSQGSSSSDGRAGLVKPSLPDQLNGVAMSIKAGTVDGDSSGSEWVSTQAKTHVHLYQTQAWRVFSTCKRVHCRICVSQKSFSVSLSCLHQTAIRAAVLSDCCSHCLWSVSFPPNPVKC